MPSSNRTAAISTCAKLDREQSYNTIDLLSYVKKKNSTLTPEQKGIHDIQVGKIFFLDVPGGTGKTFQYRFPLV